MTPLVSILIPCRNAADYVGAALDSALAQTWKNLEIIVVDDGSTDGSSRVLAEYEARGVRVISPATALRSASKSRNIAFAASRGDFIKFLDADDLLHPEMVERQLSVLAGRDVDVASAEWGRFYDNDIATFRSNPQSVWRDMDARDWLVEAWRDARPMMQVGMFLVPRPLLERAGGWDEELTLIDDFEFFARVFSLSGNIRFTSGCPLYYRSGMAGSLSGRKTRAAVESAFESLTRGAEHLLRVRSDDAARRSCANMMQDFIFTYYPHHADLRRRMGRRIAELGGSDLRPDGPRRFHAVRKLTGWKIARRIQRWVRG